MRSGTVLVPGLMVALWWTTPGLSAESGPAGVVRLDDGAMLGGADVLLVTPTKSVTILNGTRLISGRCPRTKTDVNGRFSFAPPGESFHVLVLHRRGYARVPDTELAKSGEVTLRKWGRIMGTLRIGAKPGAGMTISMWSDEPRRRDRPTVVHVADTTTDREGRFALDRVPPGLVRVAYLVKTQEQRMDSTHSAAVSVEPGKYARVAIGGTGRPIVGRIVVPPAAAGKIDFRRGNYQITSVPLPPRRPEAWGQMTAEARQAWFEQWPDSSENAAYRAQLRTYAVVIAPDGRFRVEDVPAGKYRLEATLHEPSTGKGKAKRFGKEIASLHHVFSVPPMPTGRSDEPLDLGAIEPTVAAAPAEMKGPSTVPAATGNPAAKPVAK